MYPEQGLFLQFVPTKCHHLLIHSTSLVPAVALSVLPIYEMIVDSERGVELLISASPWLTHHGIFLPFHLGNLGFLKSTMLVWKITGPKGLDLNAHHRHTSHSYTLSIILHEPVAQF